MRVSGTDDSGWMPIDLEQVALAIAALHQATAAPGPGLQARSAAQVPQQPSTQEQVPEDG